MCLFVHLFLCSSVTKAPMYLSFFFQIFFLCVCISASLFIYISLFHPLCLCLYPPLSLSPSNLSVYFCVCLPHSLFSSRPSVTLPTFPVHCRENIEQLFFARARSSTAGTNIKKFRINWVLIICQQGKKNLEIHMKQKTT